MGAMHGDGTAEDRGESYLEERYWSQIQNVLWRITVLYGAKSVLEGEVVWGEEKGAERWRGVAI